MRLHLITPVFVLLSIHVSAATFTVTSKADSGPGTLRDAITQANANGTAITDYIYFNIPATTLSDRTIILNSDLPALSSNMVIDASTQPSPG
jgi:hypothetical protein